MREAEFARSGAINTGARGGALEAVESGTGGVTRVENEAGGPQAVIDTYRPGGTQLQAILTILYSAQQSQ